MRLGKQLAYWFRTLRLKVSPRQHHYDHAGKYIDHGSDANRHMNRRPFEELVASFEDKARDNWQRPEAVLALIGDFTGKTVMDIGSGSGYFSFRMVAAGARVICADTDDRFLEYIHERMHQQNLAGTQIELRKVTTDSPALKTAEVDIVLIVDTCHHIDNRVTYFDEVRKGLKPDGKIVVVDFQKRELPVGPPVAIKLSEDEVVADLVRAGFSRITINRELLPYQYLIEAS